MEKKNNSLFTNLKNTLSGWSSGTMSPTDSNDYEFNKNKILYKGTDKAEYDKALTKAKQNTALRSQWWKVNRDLNSQTNLNNLTNIQIMYRDADLMDGYPEIGAALDIYAEEICTVNDKGNILNIYSKSERVKTVLEDLFVNRLQVHAILPMIARALCKYGNNFQYLNISASNGIIGWRQLPVHDMLRDEGGLNFLVYNDSSKEKIANETKFILNGHNNTVPFKSWQVGHFRLMLDSLFLPYGVSILQKGRRAWRQLALMEDMMLIYRLERSFERRVFKINVGAIDEADVTAYVNEIANNFKRTEVIDPTTGLLDLRKNMLGVDQDWFVPVRSETATSPIETLQGATNLDKIEDMTYMQNKLFTALSVPKPFISFDETSGDGKNLALQDIRFAKKINRIQQAMLFELNKIATIHLFLLGFTDELTNFTITMNNPSTQAEIQKIEETQKKVTLARDALADPGNGISLWSWTKVQREIFNLNDKEISELLNEIRIEKAISGELEQTYEIIKRTGVFDDVDKLYGEPNAQYSNPEGAEGKGGDSFGGGGFGGGDIGDLGDDDFDFDDEEGTLDGDTAEVPTSEASQMENKRIKGKSKNMLSENIIKRYENKIISRPSTLYMNKLNEEPKKLIDEKRILTNEEEANEIINKINKLND